MLPPALTLLPTLIFPLITLPPTLTFMSAVIVPTIDKLLPVALPMLGDTRLAVSETLRFPVPLKVIVSVSTLALITTPLITIPLPAV